MADGKMELVEYKVEFEESRDPITHKISTPEEREALRKDAYALYESSHYRTEITFKVKDEIVSGLKSINTVFRKGLRVSKDQQMLGSFGPQDKPHLVKLPRHGWEEAPSGLLSRGSYTATIQLVDDDGKEQAKISYAFDIKVKEG